MGAHDQVLGDAAIDVLAELGGRGFTHRAVDKRAGLPEGTASRYARTRAALLVFAADALFAADRGETARAQFVDRSSDATAATATDMLVRATAALLRAPRRYRARVELQLEAARVPALRRQLRASREAFVATLARLLSAMGFAAAHVRADALVAFIDGILHRQIILEQPPFSESQLQTLLDAALAAREPATPPRGRRAKGRADSARARKASRNRK